MANNNNNNDDLSVDIAQISSAFNINPQQRPQALSTSIDNSMYFIGSVTGGPAEAPQAVSISRVTTIPSINQAYRADPTAAVIANIPPHERPEDIELWNADGRIERAVEWYDEADKRAEALHSNPIYEFSRLVKAFILDHRRPLDNNLVDTNDPLTNIRVVVPPSTGLTEVVGGGQVNIVRPPPVQGEVVQPAFAVGGPVSQAEQARRQQDFFYGRQVNDALQTIGVSGRFQLDDSLVLGTELALGSLTSQNSRKFRGRKLEDFLAESAVMALMVRLTGTHLTHMNIINPKRYYHDQDSDRRKRELQAIVIEMDSKLKYDGHRGAFIICSDNDAEEQLAQLAKRIRAAKSGKIYRYYN